MIRLHLLPRRSTVKRILQELKPGAFENTRPARHVSFASHAYASSSSSSSSESSSLELIAFLVQHHPPAEHARDVWGRLPCANASTKNPSAQHDEYRKRPACLAGGTHEQRVHRLCHGYQCNDPLLHDSFVGLSEHCFHVASTVANYFPCTRKMVKNQVDY